MGKNMSLFLVVFIIAACNSQASFESKPNKTVVDDKHFSAEGSLESTSSISVNPPMVKHMWQYKITYMIPEGSKVKKGTQILSFDASQLQQKLMVKKSELEKAKKKKESEKNSNSSQREELKLSVAESKMNLDKAKRKWQQSKSLSGKTETIKLALEYKIQQVEYEKSRFLLIHFEKEAKNKLALADENINRLQGEVNQINRGIQKLSVTSPKDGMVVYSEDWNGNKLVVGETIWVGRTVMALPSLGNMIVRANIDEVDSSRISVGQKVEITIDAIPDKTFTGKVAKLDHIYRPQSKENPSVVFDALIEFDMLDEQTMRPGMSTRIKISEKPVLARNYADDDEKEVRR